jgi:hypothetical protein
MASDAAPGWPGLVGPGDLVDRMVGPARVELHRLVPLPPEPVRAAIDRFLRSQLLAARWASDTRQIWGPAPGLWVQRRRGLWGPPEPLGQLVPSAMQVSVDLRPAFGGTETHLSVGLERTRRSRIRLAAIEASFWLAVAAIAMAFRWPIEALVAVTALLAAVVALTHARTVYLRDVARVRLRFEHFVAGLERRRA